MTITNEKMTIEDARRLTKTANGSYVKTEHNDKMFANAIREIVANLHGEKPHYIK